MKTTSQAVKTAKQFSRLYAKVMRETRKRNRNSERISELKREAALVSERLVRLMAW